MDASQCDVGCAVHRQELAQRTGQQKDGRSETSVISGGTVVTPYALPVLFALFINMIERGIYHGDNRNFRQAGQKAQTFQHVGIAKTCH
jgi:hypothetical protein